MIHSTLLLRRQIDAIDRRIDRLVCELYELTAEEIAIVEEATDPLRQRIPANPEAKKGKIMAAQKLTAEQMKKCVFKQSYVKKGPDQFVPEKAEIDLDAPGKDYPDKYKEPVIETPDDVALKDLSSGQRVIVRVYDESAVNANNTKTLLGDCSDAQDRCDKALKAKGMYVIP